MLVGHGTAREAPAEPSKQLLHLGDRSPRTEEGEELGQLCPRAVSPIRRVVAGVGALDGELVLVEMPVTEELEPMLPRGKYDLRRTLEVSS